ncbi:MAG: 3-dehydroquinate synthase, partial [Flavobacteriales bacterium]
MIAANHQDMEIIEVDPGEDSKTWTIAGSIIERLLEMQADKHSVLVSLGGGMITDLGGFVGSTFKRGMRTLHVPTSLLGMVDA